MSMPELCYSFRPNAFAPERRYRIGPDALHWTKGSKDGHFLYPDICEVRLYRQLMGRGEAAVNKKIMWCLHLHCRSGRRIILSPLHCAGFRSWEDRSAAYVEFVQALLTQLRSSNPALKVVAEPHWTMRMRRAIRRATMPVFGRILGLLLDLIRNRDPDRTSRAAGRMMRAVGPWLRGHRVARANLKAAFPKKSDSEIKLMLQGMWDNFGRAMVEYAFFDRLWDYDPDDPKPGRILIDPPNLARAKELRDSGRPIVYFGAHLANWELPPAMAPAFGVPSAMLYRPPDSEAIEDKIVKMRAKLMGELIPARTGAARRLLKALRNGASIGMQVDQHFVGGIDVLFFGRKCKVNPLPARLARQFNCPIHGARAIRLADNRFRLELTEALRTPRDVAGEIDIAATMQMITWVVEGWVREHPEQWTWMHRRWR
jgi:KDO2-lipid IV(A) lauroyltransferase